MEKNLFHKDFKEFLAAFNKHNVDYLIVGGYAVILHGYVRTTGDLDLWVRKSKVNYQKIVAAFMDFGMPVFDMHEDNFLNNENLDVFTFGVPPICIELITNIKGLKFDDAFEKALIKKVDQVEIRLINFEDLIQAKKAAGRSKDKDDIEHLN